MITPPAAPPLEWAPVAQHLRLADLGEQNDAEQAYVMGVLVPAAARTATQILRRALITTSYETSCYPVELAQRGGVLVLDWPDLLAVESVLYGETPLTEGSDYTVAVDGTGAPTQPGTLVFSAGLFGGACCGGHWYSPGFSWACFCAQEALRVTYTAGYGAAAADVPANIQAWLLLRVAALYANREETAPPKTGSVDNMPFVDSLLMDRELRFS
jgi:hypothetical protein